MLLGVCVLALYLAIPAGAAEPLPVVRLLPLGDSITWGMGSSTGNGYRWYLSTQLRDDGDGVDIVGTGSNGDMPDPDNEGHSGWRIDQVAGIASSVVSRYRPNVVTLEIGTNDLGQRYDVAGAPGRLRSLLDQISQAAPDATVIVGTVIVSTYGPEEESRGQFNAAIPGVIRDLQAAGRRVRVVDMSAVRQADLSDPWHPRDGGYRKMADAFAAGIRTADQDGWIAAPAAITGPIRSGVAGNKCLDVNRGDTTDGAPVQIWGCNPTAAQQWTTAADGTLRALGKCLDATGTVTANGTKVILWTCTGGGNQQWLPHNGGLLNPASGRCLDDPGFSTADGTQLDLWDCDSGINQRWTLTPA